MAEKYLHYSKTKSKVSIDERSYQKTCIKIERQRSKYQQLESKTPPLPKQKDPSIEELLRQRKSLKKELKKIAKNSESYSNCHKSSGDDNKRKRDKDNATHNIHSTKRYSSDNHQDNITRKKVKSNKELSPEYNEKYKLVESEDEEDIIEQRRIQRKQLLEKFKDTHETKHNHENKTIENSDHQHSDNNVSDRNTGSQVKSTTAKKVTDMFSEKDEFVHNVDDHVTQDNENNAQLIDNWDDSEGYYNIKVGDIINNRYTIRSILGQGVFANVVSAQDNQRNANVAIKIVRNNDLMYKTSLKEISFLKEINDADPENKYHCIKLLTNFIHKGHLCLVLEPFNMDLRCILKKYGKNHGISMKATISYSRQLFLALRLLKKVGVIHADIKPDNILVNEKKNLLKLCDFGSASKLDENEPTPYLVSRFYRAPEIILGITYKHGVDIWSTACTIYEMATGKIMFTGSSNNKMLKCFMDVKGKFSNKFIRRGKFKDQHFNYNNNFLLHKKDEVTGRDKVVEMSNMTAIRDISNELKKTYKNLNSNEEKKLMELKDLLDKMIMLDPNQRLSVVDCLKHPFIQDTKK